MRWSLGGASYTLLLPSPTTQIGVSCNGPWVDISQDRISRLWATKGLAEEDIDPALKAGTKVCVVSIPRLWD